MTSPAFAPAAACGAAAVAGRAPRRALCGGAAAPARHAAAPARRAARAPPPPPRACATTAGAVATGAGTISVIPDRSVSVGDVLYVEYAPPEGLFDLGSDALLYWAGGFKGWTGESADETLLFPLVRLGHGRYRVSVCVPDYATSIQFGFCDAAGYAWDMAYAIPVRYQKRPKKDGTVEEFVAGGDGAFDSDLARESASPPVLTVDAEENLHKIRGEATLVGEDSGIGNVFIAQVRDTFDRFDVDRTGTIPAEKIGATLSALNFDLDKSRVAELTAKYVGDNDTCSMTEFMSLYCELELEDEGLDIV